MYAYELCLGDVCDDTKITQQLCVLDGVRRQVSCEGDGVSTEELCEGDVYAHKLCVGDVYAHKHC